MDSNTQEKKQNYLIRLFQGKIALPMTFWVWLVFGGFALTLSAGFLIGEIGLSPTPEQRQKSIVVFALINLYIFFMLIALWRSATNHEGKFWSMVSKIIAVMMAYLIASNIYAMVRSNIDKGYALKQGIKNLQKRLPQKINEEMLITYAEIDNQHITYHYQNTKIDITKDNFEEQSMKNNIERTVCQNQETAPLVKNGYTFHYSYYDKNREFLMKLMINKENCKVFQDNEEMLKQILKQPNQPKL